MKCFGKRPPTPRPVPTPPAAPARPPERNVKDGAQGKVPKSALVALLGAPVAAALLVLIPAEESGRTVEATISEDGQVSTRHISGKQYLNAYLDIVKVPTICDGDTKNVKLGDRETEAGCQVRLEAQLIAHAQPVLRCVPALAEPGRDNQLIASVSLAYNIGTNGFCRSTAARRFNAGRWAEGCDAFGMWNKAGGRVSRGLVLRRDREIALCKTGLN